MSIAARAVPNPAAAVPEVPPRFPLVSRLLRLLPGLALTLIVAGAALQLAGVDRVARLGLSALTLAIVAGMLLGNTVYPFIGRQAGPGVAFSKQQLLRLGIVLYGWRLTFQDIAGVGIAGVVIDILVLSSTFALAYWLGRRKLGLDAQSAILIGAGSSICGAAAVLATEPVVEARADKVTVAVATVVVFGTVAMFAYPALFGAMRALGVSDTAFGVFTGSTVHEVAQVVAAGRAVSEASAANAVIVKMIRVLLLAPFLVLLSLWWTARRPEAAAPGASARRIVIPWFALGFLGVAALNSLHLVPASWVASLLALDNLALATAMAALGLTTHVSALRQAGPKPLLLAAALFAWLLVGGGAINYAVMLALH